MPTPLEELALLLRPAGGGVHLVSTGLAAQQALQRRIYGVDSEAAVREAFLARLARIPDAKAVILAIPSDVGAGFIRGANLGPQGLREALLARFPDWTARCDRAGIVDLGDVFVVPQLQHDEMLGAAQKTAVRRHLYPDLERADAALLPVSPLSIAERAWELIFQLNPAVRPFALGGDHSTAWPGVWALSKVRKSWGIVQSDAHTDLLETRLGVKYCFGTWSFHANELVGREGRLVQVGIRASRHPREHWASTLGVRQFWAAEVRERGLAVIDDLIQHLRNRNLTGVYFSNDIDGTDASEASATGTPETDGLPSTFLFELIRRLGTDVGILGGDVMEVAPPIGRSPGEPERTCRLGADYLVATLESSLGVTI